MNSFLLDLIFPRKCVGCGLERQVICDNCRGFLKSKIQIEQLGELENLISIFRYSENKMVKDLIKLIKYKFGKEVLDVFDELLFGCGKVLNQNWLVVPVPLHSKRQKYRGFNQANLIAEKICKMHNLVPWDCLVRIKETSQQARLDKDDRIKNLHNSFVMREGFLIAEKCSNFLLIDDVSTTGSTLNECAKALKKAGANKVNALVLARG